MKKNKKEKEIERECERERERKAENGRRLEWEEIVRLLSVFI
jgi:hypothetical protein